MCLFWCYKCPWEIHHLELCGLGWLPRTPRGSSDLGDFSHEACRIIPKPSQDTTSSYFSHDQLHRMM